VGHRFLSEERLSTPFTRREDGRFSILQVQKNIKFAAIEAVTNFMRSDHIFDAATRKGASLCKSHQTTYRRVLTETQTLSPIGSRV
jgi:hypothetical protein